MSSSAEAMSVRFDQDSMWVELSDGRTLGVLLAWFPRWLHGLPVQREQASTSSTVVELTTLVPLGLRPSLHAAAWQMPTLPVSLASRYGKVNHTESAVLRW